MTKRENDEARKTNDEGMTKRNNDEARRTKPEGMTKRDNDEARRTKREGMTKHETRFWSDGLSVVREEPDEKRVYNLEERTARFGEAVIDFARTIPQDAVTTRLIGQLVGAATS